MHINVIDLRVCSPGCCNRNIVAGRGPDALKGHLRRKKVPWFSVLVLNDLQLFAEILHSLLASLVASVLYWGRRLRFGWRAQGSRCSARGSGAVNHGGLSRPERGGVKGLTLAPLGNGCTQRARVRVAVTVQRGKRSAALSVLDDLQPRGGVALGGLRSAARCDGAKPLKAQSVP